MRTKKGNLMHTYQIIDNVFGIVVSEFISTEFEFNYRYGYWNYLQSRKDYICKGLGYDPICFEIR